MYPAIDGVMATPGPNLAASATELHTLATIPSKYFKIIIYHIMYSYTIHGATPTTSQPCIWDYNYYRFSYDITTIYYVSWFTSKTHATLRHCEPVLHAAWQGPPPVQLECFRHSYLQTSREGIPGRAGSKESGGQRAISIMIRFNSPAAPDTTE